MIANSQALREAQEKISRRIFELLGLTLGPHHDAPLVPDTPNRVEASRKKSKAAAPVRAGAGEGAGGHYDACTGSEGKTAHRARDAIATRGCWRECLSIGADL